MFTEEELKELREFDASVDDEFEISEDELQSADRRDVFAIMNRPAGEPKGIVNKKRGSWSTRMRHKDKEFRLEYNRKQREKYHNRKNPNALGRLIKLEREYRKWSLKMMAGIIGTTVWRVQARELGITHMGDFDIEDWLEANAIHKDSDEYRVLFVERTDFKTIPS